MKGSGPILRRGMPEAVMVGGGDRMPIGGSALGMAPSWGSDCLLPIVGSGLVMRSGGERVGDISALGFPLSVSSANTSSCGDCGVPFLGRSFTPTGAFPFPISGC